MTDYWDQYTAPVAKPELPPSFSPTDVPLRTPAPAPRVLDKYDQAAIEERDRLIKGGASLNEGYADRAARGGGMAWGDEFSAAGMVPFEMMRRRTLDPVEAYKYNKAYTSLKNEKIDENTAGPAGAATEVLGGLSSIGSSLAGGGVNAIRQFQPIPSLGLTAKTIPKGVADASGNFLKGAGFGGVLGFGEGEGLEDSATKAAVAAPIGGTIGAALPLAIDYAVKPAARALQMPRLRDPERVATEQFEKAVRDSGLTMEEITKRVNDAHASGQPDFTVFDALGKAGVRKMAVLNKMPGEARERISEFITNRDLEMPTRVINKVSGEALGVQGTARQASRQLQEQASREAGPVYDQAFHSGPVWNDAIADILNTPEGRKGLSQGVRLQRLENAGSGRPFDPHDYAITGFNEAGDPIIGGVPNTRTLHTLKVGLDKMIEANTDDVTGRVNAEGRALVIMKNRLLENMDALNPAYAEARSIYRGPMEVKDAIQTGKETARPGVRYQDTRDTFRTLPTESERQGLRIGYADEAVKGLEASGNFPARFREKALKGSNELEELSLEQGPRRPGDQSMLRQFLNREEAMRKGSNEIIGGSQTFENAADAVATPGGKEVFGIASAALGGHPMAALSGIKGFAAALGSGESPAQRAAIARVLMAREPAEIQDIAARLEAFQRRQRGFSDASGNRINPFRP